MISDKISLRALEPDDLSFLYMVENNIDNWQVSETTMPFSKYLLHQYIEKIDQDISNTGQLRLVITDNSTKEAVGLIDLFNFDSIHKRCAIGIIINNDSRNLGFGQEALELLITYCKYTLNLHQLYCDIQSNNNSSINFFENNGFKKTGIKKDWHLSNKTYIDVLFYQKLL
ncbi:MAG: GNAT family N-acetyltransferase [Flavobacteriales bacterium]|nr:GNAT family N-acetyltransferase [Flavobacteriales bacterium]